MLAIILLQTKPSPLSLGVQSKYFRFSQVYIWMFKIFSLISIFLLSDAIASAQSLTVLPVTIFLGPGQAATTLKVINSDAAQTSVQARVFAWSQPVNDDVLTPTDELLVSPPIATIAPGATQVVRLVLRRAPQNSETPYRILLDQIPSPAAPGTVRIALRLSMPVFAKPLIRATSHVVYKVQQMGGRTYLVALNEGASHDTIRDLGLSKDDGVKLKILATGSPYILAGAKRRWLIVDAEKVPPSGGAVRLTGKSDGGPIDQEVRVVAPD